MTYSQRAALALAAAALLGATSLTPAQAIPYPDRIVGAQPFRLKPGEWPQALSDVKPDPDVRFGALPNGMRYAIRRQGFPAGQGAVRLWIDGGSLDEGDDQQGLAHFLEHMAFDGSKKVRPGEMVHILERLGLAFGPDTNASTGFAQTVYMLDLPKTDARTVDTALMLMRETAGNLTLGQAAMQKERGAVLSEERMRDTPAYRAYKARVAFLARGERLPERFPIGKVDVIKSARPAQIADFYHRYYRPDRAVLVVAGDFDPAVVEAKIKAMFSDWRPVGPAGADPDLGSVAPRGTEAKLVVDSGLPWNIELSWVAPPDLTPDTVASEKRDYVRDLAFAVLNRRLSELALRDNPPFISAVAARGNMENSAEVADIQATAAPGHWREALDAIEQEQRRIMQYGVRPDELNREITARRAAMKAEVETASTRHPPSLANEIVGVLFDQEVLTNPAQNLARFEEAVKGLTVEEVNAEIRDDYRGSGPLLFATAPTPIEGGESALLAELASAEKTPVAPPAAPAQVSWPYESFGPPGKVASTRRIADLGVTIVTFRNGVRLVVKPTKFTADEVAVRVNIPHGLEDLPKDRPNHLWGDSALIPGGLKKIDFEDMRRVLAGKVYSAGFSVTEQAYVFSGGARIEDLPTDLQVLTAYVTEPGWREKAFDRVKAAFATLHDQLESTEAGVLSRDLQELLHSGDERWAFPSREELADGSLPQLRAELDQPLANGPIEVVMVGDVTIQQAIEQVARTFGALPPRAPAKPEPASQLQVKFPAGTPQPVIRTHKGRADQAVVYVAWPTTDFWASPQQARTLGVLAQVMELRMLERLRRSEGVTYSPSAGAASSQTWPGYGYLAASVEVPPDKVPAVLKDIDRIAADLRAKPVGADELARAKRPRVDEIKKARVTNAFWLTALSLDRQRDFDAIRSQIPQTQKVTAADLQRAAKAYLVQDKAFKLVVRPQAK